MDTATTQSLTVRRTLAAPRERVFRAWTTPALMQRWFPDAGMEMSRCDIDLRPGGRYRFEGRSPKRPWAVWGEYVDVDPPQRLVYTWNWEHGDANEPPHAPTTVTVEFHDRGRRTEIVITHTPFATDVAFRDHQNGWIGCLERVARFTENPAA